MACPSCSFARSFARRSVTVSRFPKQRFSTTPAALEEASPELSKSAEQPLLHITKSKIRHHPSNPNARPPPPSHSNITRRLGVRFARPVLGAQEWQTSAYHYNKATLKTLPAASQATDKLLTAYVALQKSGDQPSSRTAVAMRKKSSEKVYVSHSQAKDYGDRIVIDAFIYDEAGAQREANQKGSEERDSKGGGRGRGPPGRAGPPGRGPTGPV